MRLGIHKEALNVGIQWMCDENDLSSSSRLFFLYVVDEHKKLDDPISLCPSVYFRMVDLTSMFGVQESAIYRWIRELVDAHYLVVVKVEK